MLKNTGVLTKILAIAGTAFVWFPILAPIVFSVIRFTERRMFRFDYLMPAELFPVALFGSGLLIYTSLRARSRRGIISGSLSVAVISLVGSQALAVVTGMASGETEPVGWPWVLVLTLLGVYSLALVLIAVNGVQLVCDLFRTS